MPDLLARIQEAPGLSYIDWSVWKLDVWTWGWIAWAAFFAVWEPLSIVYADPPQPLTRHLHPIFLATPTVWFIFFGLWLWVGIHLLAPTLEGWLIRSLSRR